MIKVNHSSNFYLIPLAIILAGILISLGIIFSNKLAFKTNQASLSQKSEENSKPVIGSAAPLFHLKTSKGIEVSLEDLRGQNILLVFWATWCDHSAKELSDLKKFSELYRGQIIVLAIDIKESNQIVKEYEEKEKINFTILLDEDGAVAQKYQVDGTPYHFLINQEGKIVAIWPSYASLENLRYLVSQSRR